jgi:hypothetical protein
MHEGCGANDDGGRVGRIAAVPPSEHQDEHMVDPPPDPGRIVGDPHGEDEVANDWSRGADLVAWGPDLVVTGGWLGGPGGGGGRELATKVEKMK